MLGVRLFFETVFIGNSCCIRAAALATDTKATVTYQTFQYDLAQNQVLGQQVEYAVFSTLTHLAFFF